MYHYTQTGDIPLKLFLWTMTIACAGAAMPVAQQNAAVQTYCAVCHTDAHPNGGISFGHFDAGHPDPGVTAMMASKLKGGALGASGKPLPDKATERALLDALVEESAGFDKWSVSEAPRLLAASVRQSATRTNNGEPDLYRLTVTCRQDIRQPEIQLAWSPGVPANGSVLSVVVDGKSGYSWKVEGTEKMGNGTDLRSGPGAIALTSMPFPTKTLTFDSIFSGEPVTFAFSDLDPKTRQALSDCSSPQASWL